MTRITHFNPPPAIAALLGNSLNVNSGNQFAAASAYPSNHQLRTSPPKMPWSHPYNLGHVADWLIQYGPASWRDGSRPAIRTEILNDLATRTFAAEFWTAPTPVTDRIEVAYPTLDRNRFPPPDPADPLDTANTDCDYEYRATYWPFAQASDGGWPPLPGWRGAIDADRYFIDTWHAQRSLTYKLPPLTVSNKRAFILLHLQGTIRAYAEESGVKLWFTPLAIINFFGSQSSADGYRNSIASLATASTRFAATSRPSTTAGARPSLPTGSASRPPSPPGAPCPQKNAEAGTRPPKPRAAPAGIASSRTICNRLPEAPRHPRTVRRLIQAGHLAGIKIGSRLMVSVASAHAYTGQANAYHASVLPTTLATGSTSPCPDAHAKTTTASINARTKGPAPGPSTKRSTLQDTFSSGRNAIFI